MVLGVLGPAPWGLTENYSGRLRFVALFALVLLLAVPLSPVPISPGTTCKSKVHACRKFKYKEINPAPGVQRGAPKGNLAQLIRTIDLSRKEACIDLCNADWWGMKLPKSQGFKGILAACRTCGSDAPKLGLDGRVPR